MSEADDYRGESRRRWGDSARGWRRHADAFRDATMPVSRWLVEAIAPQPGHQVLELAAGTGDVGFLAAELIRPGGTLVCSDFAPEMLTAAQERAAALGLDNVRFKQVDAESIDWPAGTLDGILCRWGFMLMADPGAALQECRRVLRPGGRLALAAWASPQDNPWTSILGVELLRRGLLEPPEPGSPGQFAWADPDHIAERLADAGFVEEVTVESVSFEFPDRTFEEYWETTIDMSAVMRAALAAAGAARAEEVREAVRAALETFATPAGALRLPARTWVAAATA